MNIFGYQIIDRVFLKTLRISIFVDSCFFSYFHVFGEESFNLQESIFEKTHLVRIHLQYEFSFITIIFNNLNNFEYFSGKSLKAFA